MTAKLVVTPEGNGTQITLLGSSGKPLLHSDRFSDPRAKGATLRALKGMLGEDVPIDDQTTARRQSMAVPAAARVGTRRRGTGGGRRRVT